jgi:hypothetical protein
MIFYEEWFLAIVKPRSQLTVGPSSEIEANRKELEIWWRGETRTPDLGVMNL